MCKHLLFEVAYTGHKNNKIKQGVCKFLNQTIGTSIYKPNEIMTDLHNNRKFYAVTTSILKKEKKRKRETTLSSKICFCFKFAYIAHSAPVSLTYETETMLQALASTSLICAIIMNCAG